MARAFLVSGAIDTCFAPASAATLTIVSLCICSCLIVVVLSSLGGGLRGGGGGALVKSMPSTKTFAYLKTQSVKSYKYRFMILPGSKAQQNTVIQVYCMTMDVLLGITIKGCT